MVLTNAQRQAAWRERQRAAGSSSHRPAQYFERAVFAQCLAAVRHDKSAEEIAQERWPDDHSTPRLLTKTAVNPAARGTAGWAGTLAADATTDFIASLSPGSAFARLRNAGMKVDLRGLDSVKVPRRASGAKPVTDVAWIAEGAPIPVKQYALDGVQVGPVCKLAMMAVLTREMIVHANGQQSISTLLREDCIASLDSYFLSTTAAVAGTSPGGLLAGVSPVTAATGGDDAAMLKDLENLAGAISDAGGADPIFIAATRQSHAANIRLLNSDAITIWPSASLTAGTVIAIEPSSFVSYVSPEPDITASTDAAAHMNTVPLALFTGGPVQSFQSDLIGLRCVIEVAYALRAPMISFLTAATWGHS